jgi:hypothetical protein
MILDLNDTIDLLASEPSQRQPAFPFEREIRLYQFQTWIYFPATTIHIPACIERLPPNTTPLSEDERLRLSDYKTKCQEMRSS